ncbi:MAG: ABC transporter substrate-binding protein [Bacteroidia bacterium]|nr:ABC transporter substrate-binding protein [Bacteroidia bacterium]
MRSQLFILLIFCCLSSCNNKPLPSNGVIATTSWTAAYAQAAGATNVTVLAPYEMVHPSEYELRPGDIGRLSKTNLIVYAGYEVMVNQIKAGLKIPEEKMIKIVTSYNFAEIEESVMLIAKRLGTEPTAIKNLKEIKQLLLKGRLDVQEKGLDKQPVLVHFFQESFARELGINPSMIFGPAPPEPKQILEMARTNAVLIIDNAHNPVGGSVKDILKNGDNKLLLNFPGLYQTRTIADVIRYNIDQLIAK